MKELLFLACWFIIEGTAFANPLKKVVVGAEDTVYGIAYNNGISTHSLIAANNLKPPYTLHQGQTLIIPSPGEHIVGGGETLHDVAELYGVNIDILAQENNIKSPFFVRQGDHLAIPSRDTEPMAEAHRPPAEAITTSSLAPPPSVKSIPKPAKSADGGSQFVSPNERIPLPQDLAAELAQEKNEKSPASASAKPNIVGDLAQAQPGGGGAIPIPPPLKETQPASAKKKEEKKKSKKEEKKKEAKKESKITFVWPVEGKILNEFSAGGKNDGINISVPEGTPVKAAASGTIMYAGNEIKGFGNLILIKHADGYITAYAHLQDASVTVKKGDKIKQGQVIASSGKTGAVKKAQLHFEIREGKRPIDPKHKLRHK